MGDDRSRRPAEERAYEERTPVHRHRPHRHRRSLARVPGHHLHHPGEGARGRPHQGDQGKGTDDPAAADPRRSGSGRRRRPARGRGAALARASGIAVTGAGRPGAPSGANRGRGPFSAAPAVFLPRGGFHGTLARPEPFPPPPPPPRPPPPPPPHPPPPPPP